MAVMERRAWSDERLDDLNQKVDAGFKENRDEFRALRGEMKGEFQAVRGELGGVRGELGGVRVEVGGVRVEVGGVRGEVAGVRGELGAQIAALHRMMLQLFAGTIVTMVLGFAGMILTLLTQS